MHANTTAANVAMLVLFGLLVSGCAHTDSAAWDRVDTMLKDARDHGGKADTDKAVAVKAWGDPVIRESTDQGDKMLWLLTADITAASPNRDIGWEAILVFDAEGTLLDRRWGYYRTPIGITEVMAATRRHGFKYKAIEKELGLDYDSHGLAGEGQRLEVNLSPRGRQLSALHRAVQMISFRVMMADVKQYAKVQVLLDLRETMKKAGFDWTVIDELREIRQVATEQEVYVDMVQEGLVVPAYILKTSPFPLVVLSASIEKQNPAPTWSTVLLNVLASGGGSHPQVGSSNMGASFGGGTLGSGFMGPYRPNAYGPGINSDATGRAFIWKPDSGGPALGPINPNAYGPGIGSDGTGRAVRPCQWPC